MVATGGGGCSAVPIPVVGAQAGPRVSGWRPGSPARCQMRCVSALSKVFQDVQALVLDVCHGIENTCMLQTIFGANNVIFAP